MCLINFSSVVDGRHRCKWMMEHTRQDPSSVTKVGLVANGPRHGTHRQPAEPSDAHRLLMFSLNHNRCHGKQRRKWTSRSVQLQLLCLKLRITQRQRERKQWWDWLVLHFFFQLCLPLLMFHCKCEPSICGSNECPLLMVECMLPSLGKFCKNRLASDLTWHDWQEITALVWEKLTPPYSREITRDNNRCTGPKCWNTVYYKLFITLYNNNIFRLVCWYTILYNSKLWY